MEDGKLDMARLLCILILMSRYRADEPVAYFCTITVLEWLPIFID
jgi:hypothetical protein